MNENLSSVKLKSMFCFLIVKDRINYLISVHYSIVKLSLLAKPVASNRPPEEPIGAGRKKIGSFTKCSKRASNIYFLTQASFEATIKLMWACSITACDLRATSELPLSTHLPTSEGWTAELAVSM